MEQKEPMEVVIHILPTYVIFTMALTCFLAIVRLRAFSLHLVRCYALLVLGTWFWQTSFVMYIPPGNSLH